jgi:hypothetical protein
MPAKIRDATGGGYEKNGRCHIRVTVAPRERQTEHAPWAATREAAIARGKIVQVWVNRLRAAGQFDIIEKIVKQGALAADEQHLAAFAQNVDVITAGNFEPVAPPKKGPITFRDFAMQWVRGEPAAKYPDHVERKRTAYTDLCNLRRYVFPVIGDKPIMDVTLDDYEQVMREARSRARNGKPRRNTRWHIAQVTYRVLGLAEYPAKLITGNPVPASAKPKKGSEVALQFIYPSEDATLLECVAVDAGGKPKVDLGHRVLFGFLDRQGWRREEALGGRVEGCLAVFGAGPAKCPRCGESTKGAGLPRRATRVVRAELARLDTRPAAERDAMAIRGIEKKLLKSGRFPVFKVPAIARAIFERNKKRSPEAA